jgi:hypothetical protein
MKAMLDPVFAALILGAAVLLLNEEEQKHPAL